MEKILNKNIFDAENFLVQIAEALNAESSGKEFNIDNFRGSAGMCAYSLLRELNLALNNTAENVTKARNKVAAYQECSKIWAERAERTSKDLLANKMCVDSEGCSIAILQAYRAHSEFETAEEMLAWWEDRLKREEKRYERLKRQESMLHALSVALTPVKED